MLLAFFAQRYPLVSGCYGNGVSVVVLCLSQENWLVPAVQFLSTYDLLGFAELFLDGQGVALEQLVILRDRYALYFRLELACLHLLELLLYLNYVEVYLLSRWQKVMRVNLKNVILVDLCLFL